MEESDTKFITEGSSKIFAEGKVFYNPVQEFNRDLSICVLNTFFEILKGEESQPQPEKRRKKDKEKEKPDKVRILEALAATGLRSIRYAKEVEGFDEIIANDLSNEAVQMMKRNITVNEVEDRVTSSHGDAMTVMYTSTAFSKRFTVIDLDPYGSPNRFLDGALQSIDDGGLLLVTATDMAVFAGNTPEACIIKYGVVPLRSRACHEIALRILLRVIEGHANRYGRYIQPLLCLSIDFYIRVFVRVYTSQYQCKMSATKQAMVHQCTGCDTLTFQPLAIRKVAKDNPDSVKFAIPTGPFVSPNCEHCNHRHHLGGPVWSDPIHDADFLKKLLVNVKTEKAKKLGTHNRILGMLTLVQEELLDVPLYYKIDSLCCTLKVEVIPQLKMRSVLLNEGFRVSLSHACQNSLKTDAPMKVIWDVLRCWVKIHPVNPSRFHEQSPLKAILAKEPEKEYDFNKMHPKANPPSRQFSLKRYPLNPAAMWGPGTRATLMVDGALLTKSFKNQGKNFKKKHPFGKTAYGERTSKDNNNDEEKSPDAKHIKRDNNEEQCDDGDEAMTTC